MPDMAEKLGVGTGVRELKIGQSFLNQKKVGTKSGSSRNGTSTSRNGDHTGTEESYHTIRYDFKPASSSTSSTGFLDVDEDNRVAVKIPHEGSGQTNFSGHQKEANAKDCLLIIDHVTGEITLEKLSSQIMVKKTRAEKPDTKASQDNINLPSSNSRPHTPNNFIKHDSGKTGPNRKSATEHKTTSRVSQPINLSGNTKVTQYHNEILQSNIKTKGGDNLLSCSSSDSSTDSDSDSDASGKVEKVPIAAPSNSSSTSGTARYKPGKISGSTTGFEVSSSKHSNQSSPSNSKVASPKQKAVTEAKPSKPIQSSLKSSQGPAKMPELNDEFDDSDESDNELSNSAKTHGQDFNLGMFTPNSASQKGRSIPNISQYSSNSTSIPVNKRPEPKQTIKSKHSSNPPVAATSTIPSMPQFLNDDLELSESDSDS